jgi:hypothetical protein
MGSAKNRRPGNPADPRREYSRTRQTLSKKRLHLAAEFVDYRLATTDIDYEGAPQAATVVVRPIVNGSVRRNSGTETTSHTFVEVRIRLI